MDIITSRENLRVKEARKLLKKKYRNQSNSYLIEGFHLLEEAIKANVKIKDIFVDVEKIDKLPKEISKFTIVNFDVLKSLSDTGNPQGLVACLEKEEKFFQDKGKILILENIQDPGNLGTLIRTADAADFSSVICLGETADIYNSKVLRSAQGSHFHLPIKAVKEIDYHQFENLLVTTLSKDSQDYREIHLTNFALVLGNEGAGVSEQAVQAADYLIHISMPGQAESLNVAVAAGILMISL
ncbi:MAG: TrmH family RNA methyltransferase [Lactovum sp.]